MGELLRRHIPRAGPDGLARLRVGRLLAALPEGPTDPDAPAERRRLGPGGDPERSDRGRPGLRSRPNRQGPGHPLGCRDRLGAADVRGTAGDVRRAPWPSPRTGVSSPRGASSTTQGREGSFVNIWDAATGELLRSLGGPDGHGTKSESGALAFSPDGKTLISGSVDKTIKLWDLETGQVLKTFEGHTACVRGVAFAPDGRRIASASRDGTVKLWDVESGDALFTSPKLSRIRHERGLLPATAGTSPRGAGAWGPVVGRDQPAGPAGDRAPRSTGHHGPRGLLLAGWPISRGVELEHGQAVGSSRPARPGRR